MFYIYNLIIHLLVPLLFLMGYRHSKNHPQFKLPNSWKQRRGILPKPTKQNSIWVHAVSTGETKAALPLIEKLRKKYPYLPITLTNGSLNGAEQAWSFPPIENLQKFMLPMDYPILVRRFLKKLQPQVLIIIETEIWPNLFHYCKKFDINILLMSTRVKSISFDKYQKYSFGLIEQSLNKVTIIGAQTQKDKERLLQMKVPDEKISIIGNIKFSVKDVLKDKNHLHYWKKAVNKNRFCWSAGSIHLNEEDILLKAHLNLLKKVPQSLLIIAPRQPTEFQQMIQICQLFCQQNNLKMACYTETIDSLDNIDIFVLDTIGVLMYAYNVSQATFVGGSLIPKGGHNILEPAMLEKPIISGPMYFDQKSLYHFALKENAVKICENEKELSDTLIKLSDKNHNKTASKNSKNFLKHQAGQIKNFVDLIAKYVKETPQNLTHNKN